MADTSDVKGKISELAKSTLDGLIQGSEVEAVKGDYIGDDGLLYCGKCRTKKETVIKFPGGTIFGAGGECKVLCQCKCQVEAERRRKDREEHEQEMLHIRRMRDASLMDAKYKNARFDTYQITSNNKRAYNLARNYCQQFDQMFANNQGVIFYGPVGTGKSYTAACIGNELLDHNQSVIMTSFVKILQNIEKQDEAGYIAMLNSAKLLILDDLGTERNTDYAMEKVYNIIDSRSRTSKPMVLTTNLSLSDMMNVDDIRYKRIYDRIFETCFPVEVPGDSFRRISAAQRYDRMERYMEG